MVYIPFRIYRSFFLALIWSLAGAPASAQISFRGLGDLPGGLSESGATAVSADGSVVVGYGSSVNGFEPFRWTANGGMVGLGNVGDVFRSARGVSADGSVVVGMRRSAGSGNFEPFRWTAGTGMIGLPDLPGGEISSYATGVSDNGLTVVGAGASSNALMEAFRWTAEAGTMGLGDLPGRESKSEAYGVSANGAVVVGYSSSATPAEGFIWTPSDGMTGLGNLLANTPSIAYGVSADGKTVVGTSGSTNGVEAFRWTTVDGMVGLGDLPGGFFNSEAYGVSEDGSVIVGEANIVSGSEAFLWTKESGMVNLRQTLIAFGATEVANWRSLSARGISADGLTIVGSGVKLGGGTEAWMATIPEPTNVVYAIVAGAFIVIAENHRRSSRRKPA